MARRALILSSLLPLLAGCGQAFKPETLIEGLRVLGIRATPAELRPGETAVLESLVLDPRRPGQQSTLFWIGCDPDPLNLGRSACSNSDVLADPEAFSNAGELPPGVRFIGLNQTAAYAAPADLFEVLPADDVRRRIGTVGQVLAIAIAEEVSLADPAALEDVFRRVRDDELDSVIALFRLRVSEDTSVNQNPVIDGLVVNGAPHLEGATVRVRPEERIELDLAVPDSSFEDYVLVSSLGEEPKTEQLITAWYSTTGRFEEPRLALRSEVKQFFIGPGAKDDPIPERRAGELYVVVRDTRGGQAWREYPLFVCDDSLPAPAATALTPAEGLADTTTAISLSGEDLSSVLELRVGDVVVRDGAYSPALDAYRADLPPLPPGEYPITLRGKHCEDVSTSLVFRVP